MLSLPEQFNAAAYFVDRNLAEGRGDALALLCADQQLTYRQVADQASRAARAFARAGIGREDRVFLLLLDSPAFVAAFWGAIKLGAVAVPVNTLLMPADYEFMLRDSGARCLVVSDALWEKVAPVLARLPEVETLWVAGEAPPGAESFEAVLARSQSDAPAAATHRDAPAFWLYTSGSTGRPKAAIHRHRDMVYCLESFAKGILGITARDRTFSASKLFFAYGLGNALYFPFGVGASTVFLPERPTAEKVFEVVRRYQPTIFYAVPTLYAAMLQVPPNAGPDDLGPVRLAVSAGEALPASIWERFRDRFGLEILDGIGSTEMLHMFISNRPGDVLAGSSGKPVPGYDARIVDEQGNDLPPGQMGNLWVRGASAAAGYWNRPDLTAETFRDEWTLTGDKYIRDERGYYSYCGRTDDMLKVSGLWVSPLEIETVLLAHPAVVEAAVVGSTDADGLTRPKAFVVVKNPAAELEANLRSFLHARLPGYKVPEWIVFADSLPKTATGKIQRFKLREASS